MATEGSNASYVLHILPFGGTLPAFGAGNQCPVASKMPFLLVLSRECGNEPGDFLKRTHQLDALRGSFHFSFLASLADRKLRFFRTPNSVESTAAQPETRSEPVSGNITDVVA